MELLEEGRREQAERYITKARYVLETKKDKVTQAEYVKLRKYFNKLSALKTQADRAKEVGSEERANRLYRQIISDLKPYAKNTSFLKLLKDMGLWTMSTGMLTAIFGLLGGLSGGTSNMNGNIANGAVNGTISGSEIGLTLGALFSHKVVEKVNDKGRREYLKHSL